MYKSWEGRRCTRAGKAEDVQELERQMMYMNWEGRCTRAGKADDV